MGLAGSGVPHPDSLALNLVRAKVAEASGDSAGALKIYEIVARTGQGAVGAEAELRATRLKHALGQLDAPAAAKIYHALRWRWRGDDTELETLRTLGACISPPGGPARRWACCTRPDPGCRARPRAWPSRPR